MERMSEESTQKREEGVDSQEEATSVGERSISERNLEGKVDHGEEKGDDPVRTRGTGQI